MHNAPICYVYHSLCLSTSTAPYASLFSLSLSISPPLSIYSLSISLSISIALYLCVCVLLSVKRRFNGSLRWLQTILRHFLSEILACPGSIPFTLYWIMYVIMRRALCGAKLSPIKMNWGSLWWPRASLYGSKWWPGISSRYAMALEVPLICTSSVFILVLPAG